MTEKPILFSDPLVRAILAGTKTQTRRLVNPQPRLPHPASPLDDAMVWTSLTPETIEAGHAGMFESRKRPYSTGDTLYVREAWGKSDDEFGCEHVSFRADSASRIIGADEDGRQFLIHGGVQPKPATPDRWRPSIHMPRWASRLTLEVTGVRVERVQDIGEEDARAEGFEPIVFSTDGRGTEVSATARERFEATWRAIYGDESWDRSDWCWVVEFKRIEAQSRAA